MQAALDQHLMAQMVLNLINSWITGPEPGWADRIDPDSPGLPRGRGQRRALHRGQRHEHHLRGPQAGLRRAPGARGQVLRRVERYAGNSLQLGLIGFARLHGLPDDAAAVAAYVNSAT